jgi:hypothetical protein
MYSFLVLGLIPGTNFQITFKAWLNIIGTLMVAVCSVYLRHIHKVRDHELDLARQPAHTN